MIKIAKLLNSLALLACISLPSNGKSPIKADILIKGGSVYDGINSKPKLADIAVAGDRIIYLAKADKNVEKEFDAAEVIDATGYTVCPGFIDPHDHLDRVLLKDKSAEAYLRMGVTSVITGMCGGSRFPIGGFFSTLEKQGIGLNVGSFTGHNTLRMKIMNEENRLATAKELDAMKKLLKKEMEDGSLGLSSGLFYVPGCFADRNEVVELCRTMAGDKGIYTTHVRNESKDGIGLYRSIVEALEIGREAGVQVNISHIKCLGKSVWHRSDSIINVIEKYRKEGMAVTADQYPYPASCTSMASALTPSWCRDGGLAGMRRRFKDPASLARIKKEIPGLIHERGGEKTILITLNGGEFTGMTLEEAARKLNMSPTDAVIHICTGSNPKVNTFVMSEDDIANFMRRPWVMTSTDGSSGSHPRDVATYAEKIQKYVIGRKVITLPEMIRRSSSLVAETYRLEDRGVLRKGAYADIIIFKAEEVRANATYTDTKALSTGFRSVIVNGVIAVENDRYTGSLSGKILRRSKNL